MGMRAGGRDQGVGGERRGRIERSVSIIFKGLIHSFNTSKGWSVGNPTDEFWGECACWWNGLVGEECYNGRDDLCISVRKIFKELIHSFNTSRG